MKESIGISRGRTYTLKGPGHEVGKSPLAQVAGGYALTHGIPADFWDLWLKQNAGSPLIDPAHPQIFSAGRSTMTSGAAREMKEVRSNLEPLRPSGDPRSARPGRPGVGEIVPDEDAAMEFAEEEN
jgi:hypothetical protein